MTTQTVHDPVCHMDIDPATAAGTSVYEAATYYFCSRGCKMDFDEDPAGVLKREAEYDHNQPHGMMEMSTPVAATAPAEAKKPWWRFW
jgi:Cu+-exporting ATPase